MDTYFSMFERLAMTFHWPKEIWTLLLQCNLDGKVQEVCSAWSLNESLRYDIVKAVIVRAYALVPESYWQSFRN